jgi:hypothetical protein
MPDIGRFIVGCLGGLAASLSKVLAVDTGQLAILFYSADVTAVNDLRVTIFIFTPILMFLGGVVGWVSGEEHRLKLLAIGCSAPALLAPWTTGQLDTASGPLIASIGITPAYAQTEKVSPTGSDFTTGLSVLLGLTSVEDQRYWVIVGSDPDLEGAQAFAEAINATSPELDAFVGSRMPGNENYAVIVGGTDAYLPYSAAEALRKQAIKVPFIRSDAYLSNFPDREPVD